MPWQWLAASSSAVLLAHSYSASPTSSATLPVHSTHLRHPSDSLTPSRSAAIPSGAQPGAALPSSVSLPTGHQPRTAAWVTFSNQPPSFGILRPCFDFRQQPCSHHALHLPLASLCSVLTFDRHGSLLCPLVLSMAESLTRSARPVAGRSFLK